MNPQLKKGALELCVLALLSRTDCYGYELVESISKKVDVSEGTIYPLLKRLLNEGYFTTYLKESETGPPRKYYHLSALGKKVLKEMRSEWHSFSSGVNSIINVSSEVEESHE